LTSVVTDGENRGEKLHHDFVVRELHGPFLIEQDRSEFNTVFMVKDYHLPNSGIVAYVQKFLGAEILQAVRLELGR
jgi:hypothetical protein